MTLLSAVSPLLNSLFNVVREGRSVRPSLPTALDQTVGCPIQGPLGVLEIRLK